VSSAELICDLLFIFSLRAVGFTLRPVALLSDPEARVYEPEAGLEAEPKAGLSGLGGHMKKFLVTGAAGQIGSELTGVLRDIYGNDHVIAAGHVKKPARELRESGPFHLIDCTKIDTIADLVEKFNIDTIYHLAAILSASAEKNPKLAWDVNVNGLYNILEVARQCKCAVFTPSSIAAFGPNTPRDKTPQDTTQRPTTIYDITKVTGERLVKKYCTVF
jgi:nucleoside-diphosphate-sugar epimerase